MVKTPEKHSGIGLVTTINQMNKPTMVAIDTTSTQIKLKNDVYTTHLKQFGQSFIDINKTTILQKDKKILPQTEEKINFFKTNQNNLKVFEKIDDNQQYTTGPSLFKGENKLIKISYATYTNHLKYYYSTLNLDKETLHNPEIQKLLITCALCDSYFIESNKILIQDFNLKQKEVLISKDAGTMLEAIASELWATLSDDDKKLLEALDNLKNDIIAKLGCDYIPNEEKLCFLSALQGFKDCLLLYNKQ